MILTWNRRKLLNPIILYYNNIYISLADHTFCNRGELLLNPSYTNIKDEKTFKTNVASKTNVQTTQLSLFGHMYDFVDGIELVD